MAIHMQGWRCGYELYRNFLLRKENIMKDSEQLYFDIQHNYSFFDVGNGYKIPIECQDGWLPLISKLCSRLKSKIWSMQGDYSDFAFTQVKEKFGELRVYTNYYVEDLADIIDEYVEKSRTICEVCGQPGTMRKDNGWFMVRCEPHWENRHEV
jgi:hypothetical protein